MVLENVAHLINPPNPMFNFGTIQNFWIKISRFGEE